ncbi:MAG: PEGA domain-containing protein, partial [Lachnospiraceae bacterium]|nr:PEGA domain-containing protein [Lachnospiraceae bacterium]
LTGPEGRYVVSGSREAGHGTLSVAVCKNQEQTLDVGDFAVEIKEGKVYFDVMPVSATVYVDSEKVDISGPVSLTYGVHFLMIRADGYETMVKYLSVGQETASLAITLEKASEDSDDDDDDQNSSDGNGTNNGNGTGSGNEANGSDTGTGYGGQASEPEVVTADDGTVFYVLVTAPEQAEVYVDGIYVGIAPIRFKKVPGSHEITLRRIGYQTRAYTIQLDDEKKDVTYSFSELLATE